MHRVDKSPFDVVVEISERRKDGGEVQSIFHRQQPFDVFKNEKSRVVRFDRVYDCLKQRAPRVADAAFFARAAERLTREAAR